MNFDGKSGSRTPFAVMLILVLVLACPVLEKSLMNHLKLKDLSCLHVNYHCHINNLTLIQFTNSVPTTFNLLTYCYCSDRICLREGPILIFEMHDLAYALS